MLDALPLLDISLRWRALEKIHERSGAAASFNTAAKRREGGRRGRNSAARSQVVQEVACVVGVGRCVACVVGVRYRCSDDVAAFLNKKAGLNPPKLRESLLRRTEFQLLLLRVYGGCGEDVLRVSWGVCGVDDTPPS